MQGLTDHLPVRVVLDQNIDALEGAAQVMKDLTEFMDLGLAVEAEDKKVYFLPLCHDDTELDPDHHRQHYTLAEIEAMNRQVWI